MKTTLWAVTIFLFLTGVWPVALLSLLAAIIITISEKKKTERSCQAEELKRQREIEQKEIDMVRKSNETLLHLIQDQHREEDR